MSQAELSFSLKTLGTADMMKRRQGGGNVWRCLWSLTVALRDTNRNLLQTNSQYINIDYSTLTYLRVPQQRKGYFHNSVFMGNYILTYDF